MGDRTAALAAAAVGVLAALLPAVPAAGAPSADTFTFTGVPQPGAVALDALVAHAPAGWPVLLSSALPGAAATHVRNQKVRVVLATGGSEQMSALQERTAPVPSPAQVVAYRGASALVRTEPLETYVASVVGAVPDGASDAVADVVAIAVRSRAAAQAAHGYVVPCGTGQCLRVGLPDRASAIGRAAKATAGVVASAHGRVIAASLRPTGRWSRTLAAHDVGVRLGYAGTLSSVTISSVDDQGNPDLLTLSGSAGDRVVDAVTLVRALRLPAAPATITSPLAAGRPGAGSELSGDLSADAAALADEAAGTTPVQPAQLPALEPAPLFAQSAPAPLIAPALPADGPAGDLALLPAALPTVLPPSALSDLLRGVLTGIASTGTDDTDGLDVCAALAGA